jgi:hypothetical protein
MVCSKHIVLTGVAVLALLSVSGTASADPGGVPHGSPNSCGVGRAEAAAFIADPTLPGASEIKLSPPGAFGCTGKPS